ncbi:MAG: hypothetical protein HY691_17600 [Chloroflexi bacterium]|nr:hypothetical protein [Chloroflexota bacterium]
MSAPTRLRAQRLEVEADFLAANAYLEEQGWTDGLPVIPPTEELVRATLAHAPHPSGHVLGKMEPLNGTVTVEKVAANAVMAGCRPEYLPVVLAAVKAVLQPQFNVGSTACTTGGAAPAIIVSGPVAARLGINSGTACLGGNVKANATIGRALRLTMRNLGGAKPGGMEKSTLAWPGKLTCCFAENEERSPWEPLRVALGYPATTSTVTVVAVRGICPFAENAQETGLGVLQTVAGAMRGLGISSYYQLRNRIPVVVVLGPEHAAEIARAGFARRDVQQYLFEHARMPVGELDGRGYYTSHGWPPWIDASDPQTPVPIVAGPDRFIVVVAGGDGRHSAWLPAWSMCREATEVIEER